MPSAHAVGENFVIEYRISADECAPGQMHFPETLEFIKYIKDKVDILHVSSGIHDLWGEILLDALYAPELYHGTDV